MGPLDGEDRDITYQVAFIEDGNSLGDVAECCHSLPVTRRHYKKLRDPAATRPVAVHHGCFHRFRFMYL